MARSKKVQSLTYPGPTWTEVQSMSDAQIDQAFVDLKHTPRKTDLYEDDNEMFVCAFGNKEDAYSARDYTKVEIAALRTKTYAWYRTCLRNELFRTYIERWVFSLSADLCWSLVEACDGLKPTLNDKRYTAIDVLRRRTVDAVGRREHHNSNRKESK